MIACACLFHVCGLIHHPPFKPFDHTAGPVRHKAIVASVHLLLIIYLIPVISTLQRGAATACKQHEVIRNLNLI
jgi:hypothetical protein